jgi:YjbE family integral membrane protein
MTASLAPYLNPAQWNDWFHASATQLTQAAYWLAILRIIAVNIVLSGDNAVVIAMACRGLPLRQRFWGMVIGVAVAVILRIGFTGVIAQLMLLPYLKLLGGFALFYIAAKLVASDDAEEDQVAARENLWRVIGIIAVADVVMSFDNIVAIAATANGDFLLLAIGLLVSIPLILAGATVVAALLASFPILIWAGAALLGWIAGEVMVGDPVIAVRLPAAFGEKFAQHVEFAAACSGAMLGIALGGLWRRLHEMAVRARAARAIAGAA